MIALIPSHVRFSVSGSCAIAFQKLLIQSVFRVAMMSSYTGTSGLASLYSISGNVGMRSPKLRVKQPFQISSISRYRAKSEKLKARNRELRRAEREEIVL